MQLATGHTFLSQFSERPRESELYVLVNSTEVISLFFGSKLFAVSSHILFYLSC